MVDYATLLARLNVRRDYNRGRSRTAERNANPAAVAVWDGRIARDNAVAAYLRDRSERARQR